MSYNSGEHREGRDSFGRDSFGRDRSYHEGSSGEKRRRDDDSLQIRQDTALPSGREKNSWSDGSKRQQGNDRRPHFQSNQSNFSRHNDNRGGRGYSRDGGYGRGGNANNQQRPFNGKPRKPGTKLLI